MPKTTIACFSATGNSLYIAKRLEADKMITIGKDSSMDDDTEILGIVTPVYCGTLPLPVKEFISSVIASRDNSNLKYIFGLLTYGKAPLWAASHLARALQDAGCVLSYVNGFQMPDAYLPLKKKAVKNEERDRMLSDAAKKLERIRNDIKNEEFRLARMGLSYRLIGKLMYNAAQKSDNRLSVTDKCIGCSICASACPMGNIGIENGKAVFAGKCLCCYACYHICPQNAMVFPKAEGRYGMPENMKGRYR